MINSYKLETFQSYLECISCSYPSNCEYMTRELKLKGCNDKMRELELSTELR